MVYFFSPFHNFVSLLVPCNNFFLPKPYKLAAVVYYWTLTDTKSQFQDMNVWKPMKGVRMATHYEYGNRCVHTGPCFLKDEEMTLEGE